MTLIQKLVDKLQRHPKRFVFPDGSDARILQAARQIVSRGMGAPLLIGDRERIKATAQKLDINTMGMRLIEPERSSELAGFVAALRSLPRFSDLDGDAAKALALDPNVFATLMLRGGQADALVAGATAKASSALRPLFRIVGVREGVQSASSLMILDMEARQVGIDGVLFMADCGVIPEPTATQLADIALVTGGLAHHLTNALPKVAMLSYATRNTAGAPSVERVREAARLAREKADALGLRMEIEGEMQVDAALDRATAILKGVGDSPVAGSANVLVFPDLNCGNIASKLVQILTGANTYGQIIMGLKKPAAEISRGASAHDVLGAAAIVGCQAIDRQLLYGAASMEGTAAQ